MHIEEMREYCLSLKGARETFPFDENTLVFKVMDKMFALTDLAGEFWINLKCDPEKAISLREEYPAVTPGYHMNKKHWNTVAIDGTVDDALIKDWISESYEIIVKNLSKKLQQELHDLF